MLFKPLLLDVAALLYVVAARPSSSLDRTSLGELIHRLSAPTLTEFQQQVLDLDRDQGFTEDTDDVLPSAVISDDFRKVHKLDGSSALIEVLQNKTIKVDSLTEHLRGINDDNYKSSVNDALNGLAYIGQDILEDLLNSVNNASPIGRLDSQTIAQHSFKNFSTSIQTHIIGIARIDVYIVRAELLNPLRQYLDQLNFGTFPHFADTFEIAFHSDFKDEVVALNNVTKSTILRVRDWFMRLQPLA